MGRKNNMFRVKIDFEEIPITDEKVEGLEGVDNIFNNLKKKFGGKK